MQMFARWIARHRAFVLKLSLATVLAIGIVAAFVIYGQPPDMQALVRHESALRQYHAQHPLRMMLLAYLVYAVASTIPLPGSSTLTILYGWLFGIGVGTVIVSFGSMTGAASAFLLSRYFFRDAIQERFAGQLHFINKALRREGAFYLISLRLIPVIPFFALNIIMGVTPLSLATFWWGSQLGMLPGTFLYVYAGSTVPDLTTLMKQGPSGIVNPQLVTALVLLAVFPWVVRWLRWRWTQRIGR